MKALPKSTHMNILHDFLRAHSLYRSLCPSKITLSPLKGGKSSANLYQFELNDSRFVLRLPPPNANLLTRAHQSFLAKQAGELEVGPKVCYIDPQFNGLILHYVPGKEAKLKDFENVFLIDKMANILRKLHQAKQNFPLAVSPFKRFNDFIQKNICQNNKLEKIKSCMDEIEQTLRFYPILLCPTHLDLHLSNIILKEKEAIFLVDWVNGGMSDPFFDLATFSYFSELNEVHTERFLTSYFQRAPNEIEKARFNVILPVRLMVIAASYFSSPSNNTQNGEFYIEKSICLIESETFKRSLKVLQNIALKTTI